MPETRMVVKLLATSAVTDLIGDRLRKHQRKTAWGDSDAITYQRISTTWSDGADVKSGSSQVRIQLDLWSSTPLGLRTLVAAVSDALRDWTDTGGSPAVSHCRLISESEMPEGPGSGEEATEYRWMQEYHVQYSV